MDIQKKQAKWNQERPLFEAELVHSYWLQFFNFYNNTGDYELKESLQNDEDAKLAFEVVNTGWVMWLRAKAQKVAVPEWISLEDVEPNIGETVLICWSDGFDVEPEKDFMDVDIDSGVHYWSNFENDEPTHWMPIPQPPKAQEQVG